MSSESLIDEWGRVIPIADEIVYSKFDRRYFCLDQKNIDLDDIYQRASAKFSGLSNDWPNYGAFEAKLAKLKSQILSSPKTKNLFSGVHLPFLFPNKFVGPDIANQKTLIDLAGQSFIEYYEGKYTFSDLASEDLPKIASIKSGSRWEKFRDLNETIIGWYFPTALAGFAISDHVKVISRMPQNFILSGIPEVSSAIIGTPSIFDKKDGKYPNLLALTAFESSEENKHMFWFYEAYGWNLIFNRRSMLGAVSEYYSGGISVIE